MFDASELARLTNFVRESNAIEGIFRDPTPYEIEATKTFIAGILTVSTLCALQEVYAPGKPLRDRVGLNVYVGNHVAPAGGPDIPKRLDKILLRAFEGENTWQVHIDYEDLHPFCDGNGRTGRALWAWQMYRRADCFAYASFLHQFYYQTLENTRPTA